MQARVPPFTSRTALGSLRPVVCRSLGERSGWRSERASLFVEYLGKRQEHLREHSRACCHRVNILIPTWFCVDYVVKTRYANRLCITHVYAIFYALAVIVLNSCASCFSLAIIAMADFFFFFSE